jgi:hypothetical protein
MGHAPASRRIESVASEEFGQLFTSFEHTALFGWPCDFCREPVTLSSGGRRPCPGRAKQRRTRQPYSHLPPSMPRRPAAPGQHRGTSAHTQARNARQHLVASAAKWCQVAGQARVARAAATAGIAATGSMPVPDQRKGVSSSVLWR